MSTGIKICGETSFLFFPFSFFKSYLAMKPVLTDDTLNHLIIDLYGDPKDDSKNQAKKKNIRFH